MSATTVLWSLAPKLPIRGFATIQSEVSFGQFGPAGWPVPPRAVRSSEAVPSTASSPGLPSMSATDGPVMNWRSLTTAGKPGWKVPWLVFQAPTKSWLPCWYSLTARSRARRSPAAGASRLIPPAKSAKAGCPTAGKAGTSWFALPGGVVASTRGLPAKFPRQELPSAFSR